MRYLFAFLFIFSSTLWGYEKPTFLLLYSGICSHCSSFIKNSMGNKEVQEALRDYEIEMINIDKKRFIPYDIDFLGIVPSIHIINSKKVQLVNTITGDIPPYELVPFLRKFTQLYQEFQQSGRVR